MSVHEQFAENLALHALGVLEGEERVALEKHLEGCAGCRRELEQLRGDMALMALSTGGPTPPRRARQRLLEAVAREPRPRAVTCAAGLVGGSYPGLLRRRWLWGWSSCGCRTRICSSGLLACRMSPFSNRRN